MNYIEIEDLIITLNINDICTMIQCFLQRRASRSIIINVVGGKHLRHPDLRQSDILFMGGMITKPSSIFVWHLKKKKKKIR